MLVTHWSKEGVGFPAAECGAAAAYDGGSPQWFQMAKNQPKTRFKILWNWLITLKYVCKFWIWSACNDRKRKLFESAESCLKIFVKSHQVNLFLACFSHLEPLCGRLGGPEPPYTPWGSRAAKPRGCRRGPHGWLPRSAAHRAAHAAALPRSTAPPSNQYSSARLLVLARGCCEWHARAHCSLRTLVVNPCNHSGTLGDCPSSTSFMYLGFSPGSGPFWLVLGQIPFAWTKYWDSSQSNKTVRPSTSIKPLQCTGVALTKHKERVEGHIVFEGWN